VSQQPARPDYSGPGKSDVNGTSLEGKIALITGAARAIGRATALRLSRQGATLAVHYRTNAELAESLASAIRAENRKVLLVQGDVTEESQVKSIVAQVSDKLGPVDILVNNAANFYPGELADFKEPEMDSMWRTNVIGPVHLIRLVVEGMKERRSGRIVNITSAAGLGTSIAGTTFYSATKAALAMLTRRFAMELGPYGITVNAVSPGFIPTEASLGGRSGQAAQERIDMFTSRSMLRRVGIPEDIAYAVSFFVAPAAGFITAQVLSVDGGRMDFITHSG
jgi:3-oxoacyl-[acyl-carrier protein] reductase